jgi:hypothetical protein
MSFPRTNTNIQKFSGVGQKKMRQTGERRHTATPKQGKKTAKTKQKRCRFQKREYDNHRA